MGTSSGKSVRHFVRNPLTWPVCGKRRKVGGAPQGARLWSFSRDAQVQLQATAYNIGSSRAHSRPARAEPRGPCTYEKGLCQRRLCSVDLPAHLDWMVCFWFVRPHRFAADVGLWECLLAKNLKQLTMETDMFAFVHAFKRR